MTYPTDALSKDKPQMTNKSNLIIKVCGMRDADNIQAVDSLAPVDWMGFIFYPPSPRFVSHRPAVMPNRCKRAGVFVDAATEEIIDHQSLYSLDIIQLHGHETGDYCRQLRSTLPEGTSIIKTVQVFSPDDILQTAPFEGLTDFLLFETRCDSYGGSGQQFDWDMLHLYQGTTPFILSGGIGPSDTAKVQAFSHPMLAGIDLNSKFETAPAVKDIQTLTSFIDSLH